MVRSTTLRRLLFAVGVATSVSACYPRPISEPKPEVHGFALVYATGLRDRTSFVTSASLTLPARRNRSWYCSWLMIIPFTQQAHAPFVQVGLMRRPEISNKLTPFVAINRPGQPHLDYFEKGYPKLANDDRPHTVDVALTGTKIVLRIDGHVLKRLSRSEYLPPDRFTNVYGQLGSEVSAFGDRASGSVDSIAVHSSSGRAVAFTLACGSRSAGLALQRRDSTYVSSGVLRPLSPGLRETTFVLLPSMKPVAGC